MEKRMRLIGMTPLIALFGALALAACSSDHQAAPPATASSPAPVRAVTGNPSVGGAAMYRGKTIMENAAATPILTTLVKAVQAADLVHMLSGPGSYTLFAPTNEAFGRLAPGTVDTLLKPENKPSLVKVLSYHIVPGAITAVQIRARIAAGGGTARLTTVEGDALTASLTGDVITLTDVNGNKSYLETGDILQSNGVMHVVNGMLIPKLS